MFGKAVLFSSLNPIHRTSRDLKLPDCLPVFAPAPSKQALNPYATQDSYTCDITRREIHGVTRHYQCNVFY